MGKKFRAEIVEGKKFWVIFILGSTAKIADLTDLQEQSGICRNFFKRLKYTKRHSKVHCGEIKLEELAWITSSLSRYFSRSAATASGQDSTRLNLKESCNNNTSTSTPKQKLNHNDHNHQTVNQTKMILPSN